MLKKALLFLLFLVGPANALTAFYGAEDVRQMCRETDEMCAVYISGLIDGHFAMTERASLYSAFCIPLDVSREEVSNYVAGYLIGTQEDLTPYTAADVVYGILSGKYPCRG